MQGKKRKEGKGTLPESMKKEVSSCIQNIHEQQIPSNYHMADEKKNNPQNPHKQTTTTPKKNLTEKNAQYAL